MLSKRTLEEHATGYRRMTDMGEAVYKRIGPMIDHLGPVALMYKDNSYSFTLVDEQDAALRSVEPGMNESLRTELQTTRTQKLHATAVLGITSLVGAAIETPTGSFMRDILGGVLGAGVAGIGHFVKRQRHFSSIERRLRAVDSRLKDPTQSYSLSGTKRQMYIHNAASLWENKIKIQDGEENLTYSPREILAWIADSILDVSAIAEEISIKLNTSLWEEFLLKDADKIQVPNAETAKKIINDKAYEFMRNRDSRAKRIELPLETRSWPSLLDKAYIMNKFSNEKPDGIWDRVYGRSTPIAPEEWRDVTFADIVLPPGVLVMFLIADSRDLSRLWNAIQPGMSQLVHIQNEREVMEQSKKATEQEARHTKPDINSEDKNGLAVIDERTKAAIQLARQTNMANCPSDPIQLRVRSLENQELLCCLEMAAHAYHINQAYYHEDMKEEFLDAFADTIAASANVGQAIEFAESVVNVYAQFVRGKDDAASQAVGERLLAYLQEGKKNIGEDIQQLDTLRAGLVNNFPEFDWQAASQSLHIS